MFGPVHLRGGVVVPDDELAWRFSRAGGPGGQNVNKTDSRVELSWDAERSAALSPALRERVLERLGGRLVRGVLTIAASEQRSQLRNREAALARFVALLDAALAPPGPPRRATRPSRNSRRRRTESEQRRRQVKAGRRRPPAG
ncbi:alternative ribosome rescue aminoacyl-tRNA hydrolase ArfB [Pengzhenrongella sicca]|uniref:Aminoacyl-tRNA hydrolase n=1 Tax=Pengzhenrongella sicca TaxID=2819238 RepID=A0A8A4ZIS3_9MICO|nr:alternative ribosome rescue aminoacyl-tRNA hydrolase ArfB [Pengzhenrongella sicca]QTE31281.1 aminoacyl-tRNA hydrolase [Pengzhenrongella sicca]